MLMYIIYKIEFNGFVYIGSTRSFKDRLNEHNYELRKKRKHWRLYKRAWEFGVECFDDSNSVVLETVDDEERYEVEQYYIDEYRGEGGLNARNSTYDQHEYYLKNKVKFNENSRQYRIRQKLLNHPQQQSPPLHPAQQAVELEASSVTPSP